jgi:hypothetical protein
MRVIGLAVALVVSLTLAPLATETQSSMRIPRIGALASGTAAGVANRHEAFPPGLRELGYVEGHSIVTEYRSAEGTPGRLPVLAAELVRLSVNLIVTDGDHGIRAARQATQAIRHSTADAVVVESHAPIMLDSGVPALAVSACGQSGFRTLSSSFHTLTSTKSLFPRGS